MVDELEQGGASAGTNTHDCVGDDNLDNLNNVFTLIPCRPASFDTDTQAHTLALPAAL
jgi:hypothetical protein